MVYLNFQMYKTYVDVKNGFAIEGNNSRTEVELGLLLMDLNLVYKF